jgi:RNA polymerase sigma-70 factor, ECF subfamily
MVASDPTKPNRREGPPQTLGNLLYADETKPRTPEEDWADLVRRIAMGDEPALHALFERAHRMVFTMTARMVNNRETAEELTLDVFHEVWRRASTYDAANGPVIGWIMNLAQSRAIDRLRFDQRKKRVNYRNWDVQPGAAAADPQTDFTVSEQRLRLQEALAALTPDERRVIEAAFFSEMTYAEAAARLNQPLGTVKSRIRSGLVKLRRSLHWPEAESQ